MQKGAVIWICGLAGAGKTTYAQDLYLSLKKERDNVVLLDGDVFRSIFQEEPDFTANGRLRVAKKISALCSFLSSNGMIVVCATISLFEEIYFMNRQNIPHYFEVFVKCSMEELRKRDKKNLYSKIQSNAICNVMGVDIPFVVPKAHCVLNNNQKENLEYNQQLLRKEVDKFLAKVYEASDKGYWYQFYTNHMQAEKESHFAAFCMKNYFKSGQSLIELGCGNGRDSLYFAKNNLKVLGVDQCDNVIAFLQQYKNHSLKFQCADFTKLDLCSSAGGGAYDIVYSRFTLHSITQNQQNRVFEWVRNHLQDDGLFAMEVRGHKNSLYRMGIPVIDEKDAFIFENHYRRFLKFDMLLEELKDFNIIYAKEDKGFAPFRDEDDYFIRVIAQK
ncbi:adenylyl-sulfate kinase [uncultured Helicobacter sp.]|uniref:adenylyl-sulfate kinase n=1 Tax=uncultured Helicobacter sp. TaxID=175537 RepID=UPI002631A3A8|nr:adenylyl-sulfate kinase [uncultured Helicobacter sp.]